MAEKDIIQNLIFQLGQSQVKRMPEELKLHFADVDERTPEDFLLFIKKLSTYINYYRTDISTPAGDWSTFFPYTETEVTPLLETDSGNTAPHLGLLLAFLELYKHPQAVINRITGRHLDFYYKEILRLSKKAAVPDKAHVLIELKKNAAPISLGGANPFSAGKDAAGVELIYAPTGDTVINQATVLSLRSVFLDSDSNPHGTVRSAPIANSSDGMGGELTGDEPRWRGFGYKELPPAEVGFAIASPVLRMQEGARAVTVTLALNHVDSAKLHNTALQAAFEVFITGEKHWLGPYSISPTLSLGNILQFNFIMPESEKAVVDYDPAVHGYSYTAQAPVLQVLLKTNNFDLGYHDLKDVTVKKAQVEVEVSNIVSLALESDAGTLDPKKAFLPFGPQPTGGSRFFLGYAEALTKKLVEVKVTVQWKDAPANFAYYYSGYGVNGVKNDYFTAAVSFKDGGNWGYTNYPVPLFDSSNASSEHTIAFRTGPVSVAPRLAGMRVYALQTAGSLWARKAARQQVLVNPMLLPFKTAVPKPRSGVITFSLKTDFLQGTYRQKYIESVMAISQTGTGTLPKEPYTPAIQSISLSYKAHSDQVDIGSTLIDDFSTNEVQFFHLSYFGQMREHGYQRAQFSFLTDKNVSLLPAYRSAGELLIGFKDLNPGDSVSVLFQVAEGSADPDLEPEDLSWSALCDNYWKPLRPSEVVLDTTNQLLTSGVINFILPAEATTSNTILPADRLWIKGALAKNVNAVCQLIEVAANAVEVKFTDHGNDPSHLAMPLEQGKIGKLKNGVAEIKSVQQPFASFGGWAAETDEAFYTRVSERLRHKNRCITAWDYERVILEAFPLVHEVKCIPHAKEGSWLAPGHVLIVVVPDLKHKNAVDPFKPKVDADTLSRITAYVQQRTGMGVQVKVKNPTFQEVQLDFNVKFQTGYEFNFYSGELNQALIRFLSPWAYDASRDISFGGKISKSVLLDFVDHLNYVDYVTELKLYSYTGATRSLLDLNTVEPETPEVILVSAKSHIIGQAD